MSYDFDAQVNKNLSGVAADHEYFELTQKWLQRAIKHNYAQNFSWLGRPIVQVPQDIYAIQEIIWTVRPDLVIETGIAHGGSLILSASMLALLDYCDAVSQGVSLDPSASSRKVIGVDIDIRQHNRKAIEAHPMAHMIHMIQGSAIDIDVIDQVRSKSEGFDRVLVFLDSNHTHDHVLEELNAYAPLVSVGSYCVVWDTGVEDLPDSFCTDRPWGKGNNPKTAVWAYLESLKRDSKNTAGNHPIFEIDKKIENKIMITASPDGFLKRIG